MCALNLSNGIYWVVLSTFTGTTAKSLIVNDLVSVIE